MAAQKHAAMRFTLESLGIIAVLLVAMLAAQAWGRKQGERHRLLTGTSDKSAFGATEGAVFALLGLFLAFAFSGAGGRFDDRRLRVIDEVNAIGTAWLRIDLLPSEAQPAVRELFREYLDARLEAYRLVSAGARIDPRRFDGPAAGRIAEVDGLTT